MQDPLIKFSFQLVLNDWYKKCCGMNYPAYGMVHIEDPLMPIGKSSICSGSSGFPFYMSDAVQTYVVRPIATCFWFQPA